MDYDVEVRLLAPTIEVPICSYATTTAHYVRAKEKDLERGTVVQKTKTDSLSVDVVQDENDYPIIVTQGTPAVSAPVGDIARNWIANALGIAREEICREYPVAIASTGRSKVMVLLYSNELLHGLQLDLQKLTEISKQIECNGYYAFTLNPQRIILVHGRMFVPTIGITEDPVTGSSNGPLGAYLVHYNILQDADEPCLDFDILQGEAVKRDGIIHVHVEKEHGTPKPVQIMGNAVTAFSAEITIQIYDKELNFLLLGNLASLYWDVIMTIKGNSQ